MKEPYFNTIKMKEDRDSANNATLVFLALFILSFVVNSVFLHKNNELVRTSNNLDNELLNTYKSLEPLITLSNEQNEKLLKILDNK